MTGQRGFTLLEAAIALAVLAIGLGAAMRALGLAANSVSELRERQLADWLARDRLAEIRLGEEFPAAGDRDSKAVQGGQRFRLQENTTMTANPMFRRIRIRVVAEDRSAPLVELTGFAVEPLR